MIRLNELKLPLGATNGDVLAEAAKELRVSTEDILRFSVVKRSVDCRHKNDIHLVFSAELEVNADESALVGRYPANKASLTEAYEYRLPETKRTSPLRPVVVGFGPAGIFAALTLARAGLRPIVLERGSAVDERTAQVNRFWTERTLDTESNVQFGEGGAGTFSDGKLTTGIKDSRCREVFLQFVKFGAPEDILISATPHIGTDKLKSVVKNMREEVLRLGGEVRFNTRMTRIYTANGAVAGVATQAKDGSALDYETDAVILAIGHSSRDTLKTLYDMGLTLTQKPFSVGARIEHPQEYINKKTYGRLWNSPLLPPAVYKLSAHPEHGRGLYTFCMCPGGTVVTASSEEGGLVVNGMSEYARDRENANSALLVGVEPPFDDPHPLAGIEIQRRIERAAFALGGGNYTAPAQTLADFMVARPSRSLGTFVNPSCPTGVTPADLHAVLPAHVCETLCAAMASFDRQLPGFAHPEAVLTGPESRSSSPVRIQRDEFYQATELRGLYPAGEGAGYAGGIVSAAVDGIKCAEAIITDANY